MFTSRLKECYLSMVVILTVLLAFGASAGEVSIEYAKFKPRSNGTWRITVTVRHLDEGWGHYADAWRVVAEDGSVIATRKLAHPHVDEQPVTRSLDGVKIPPDATYVYVEAKDNVHGWSADRLAVELHRAGDRFEAR